jgi:hypothetical protein
MAAIIRIKRSATAGNPTTLGSGELAYSSLVDNGSNGGDRLYIGTGTETAGNAANHVVIGGKYFTDQITAATALNTASTIVKRDATGNFSAGTITAALSGNASTASKWASTISLTITGDLAYTTSFDGSGNVTAAGTLVTILDGSTNKVPGTYGTGSAIPVVTVDAKGRVTSISTIAPAAATLGIAGGTGTDSLTLGTDTLTFEGGTGVTTTVTDNKVSFAIGQAVGTTSAVSFASLSTTGNVTVGGNLVVNGTTTSVNSTTLDVTDLNITVAKGAVNAAAANGAGLTVDGAGATLTYSSGNDRWNFNKDLTVGTVFGALSGNASTATKWAGSISLSITGDLSYTTSFDGSGNVTAAGTLATVNSNVGTFGSSTVIPSFTVNAKGLVTAVTTNSIPNATTTTLGLASFNSTDFSVSSGAVSIASVDGGTY